jgi:hypothetical protein
VCQFIAIPVGQGDAFYLQTAEGSVLVDGGRSISGFPYLFRSTTGTGRVDVLVATHNDADHANGVLGFLRSGLRCREVWLPGRWAQVLPQVLRPREEILYVLTRQAADAHIVDRRGEGSLLEQYAQTLNEATDGFGQSEGMLQLDESGWPVEAAELFEAASEDDEWWAFPWAELQYGEFWLLRRLWSLPEVKGRLLRGAIVAAERIRQIALAAYHRGIPVRWFEWNAQNPGGGFNWLLPLNSRQLAQVKPIPEGNFLDFLALTVANKESLVFWSPPAAGAGGVLFTADSDLNGVNFPPLAGAIVTAPHHGSEANKNVYSLISQPVIWVRSDGKSRKRPGQTFLQPGKTRFCTLCRNPKSRKSAVMFFGFQGAWRPSGNVNGCICI